MITWKKIVLCCSFLGGLGVFAACSSTPAGGGDGGINCGAGSVECAGTCTVVARDSQNCGACGKACASGELCSAGTCVPAAGGCTMGTTKCGNECVNAQNDARNCGMCGKACASNEVCMAGACAASCGMGTMKCGQSCVNTQTDRTNCGGCGTTCKDGEICNAGMCALSCQQGLTKCPAPMTDGGVVDGGPTGDVCSNLQTDSFNCGSCGKVCGATEKCLNGSCAKLFGPVHNFVNLPTDHYITQGSCSLGMGMAADADYFCKRFYGMNCVVQPGFKAHSTPYPTYPKMHKRGGCTSNGTDIPNTTCDQGACKVGNWSENTSGINNLVCLCP